MKTLFENFINERKGNVSPGTFQNYQDVFKTLMAFAGAGPFPAKDDPEKLKGFIVRYLLWLVQEKKLQNGTIKKHRKIINSVLNYFEVPVKITEKSLPSKSKSDNSEILHCNSKDLMDIYNHQSSFKSVNKTLDLYVFCAFTGLRFSETQKLVIENVKSKKRNDVKYHVLVYHSYKTGQKNEVPLNDICMSILDRWRFQEFPYKEVGDTEKILPYVPRVQVYNYLRKGLWEVGLHQMQEKYGLNLSVGELEKMPPIGLWEKELYIRYSGNNKIEEFKPKWKMLTFHTSRHTYAAWLLFNNVDIYKVSKLLGHSSVVTTEKWYAKLKTEEFSFEIFKNTENVKF